MVRVFDLVMQTVVSRKLISPFEYLYMYVYNK